MGKNPWLNPGVGNPADDWGDTSRKDVAVVTVVDADID